LTAKELRLGTELYQRPAHRLERSRIYPSEIGNGLVIGRQTIEQPHELNVAPALALKPARRAHLVQVPVEIQSEQVARVIRRAAGRRRLCLCKAKLAKIQTSHEGIDPPDGVLRRH
jgi:hypothetical protein